MILTTDSRNHCIYFAVYSVVISVVKNVKREGGREIMREWEGERLCERKFTLSYIYKLLCSYIILCTCNPICSELSGTQAGMASGTIKNDTSTGQKKGLVCKHYETWRHSYVSTCRWPIISTFEVASSQQMLKGFSNFVFIPLSSVWFRAWDLFVVGCGLTWDGF